MVLWTRGILSERTIWVQMFVSTHYAGKEVGMKFRNGEAWNKVFGPVLVYLNSVSPEDDINNLWEDAKQQVLNVQPF